jgi:hypothetical protein
MAGTERKTGWLAVEAVDHAADHAIEETQQHSKKFYPSSGHA